MQWVVRNGKELEAKPKRDVVEELGSQILTTQRTRRPAVPLKEGSHDPYVRALQEVCQGRAWQPVPSPCPTRSRALGALTLGTSLGTGTGQGWAEARLGHGPTVGQDHGELEPSPAVAMLGLVALG